MSVNQHFLEKVHPVSAIVPVNMQTGANNGDWVSLKDYGRCAIVFFAALDSTSTDAPTLTLSQAKDVSGTSSKGLTFTRADYVESTALTAGDTFTTVTQAAASTFSVTGSGGLQKIWVVDIKAEDLDIANGFCCLQAAVTDAGTTAHTQLGCALYMLHEPRYEAVPDPSATVN
jgi:hypothetical protein